LSYSRILRLVQLHFPNNNFYQFTLLGLGETKKWKDRYFLLQERGKKKIGLFPWYDQHMLQKLLVKMHFVQTRNLDFGSGDSCVNWFGCSSI